MTRPRLALVCCLAFGCSSPEPGASGASASSSVASSPAASGPAPSESAAASSAPSDSAATPSASSPPGAPPGSPLDAKAFAERGMPPLDRAWTSKDYAAAARVLDGLPSTSWPRLDDPASGPVFARFVADDNLDAIRSDQGSLDTRGPESAELLASSRKLSALYMTALAQGAPFRREALAWVVLHIEHGLILLDVADAFIQTLDPKDAKYPVRMKGFAQMQDGVAETALGSAIILSETSSYRASDLAKFCARVRTPVVKIAARSSDERRAQILAKLDAAAAAAADPDLKSCVTVLARAARASAPRPAAAKP